MSEQPFTVGDPVVIRIPGLDDVTGTVIESPYPDEQELSYPSTWIDYDPPLGGYARFSNGFLTKRPACEHCGAVVDWHRCGWCDGSGLIGALQPCPERCDGCSGVGGFWACPSCGECSEVQAE